MTSELTAQYDNFIEYALIEICPGCVVLIFGPVTLVVLAEAHTRQQSNLSFRTTEIELSCGKDGL